MKYWPQYPRIFDTLETARTHIEGYVHWHNHEHKHSGIVLFTPAQVIHSRASR